jgi:hypothetical protein
MDTEERDDSTEEEDKRALRRRTMCNEEEDEEKRRLEMPDNKFIYVVLHLRAVAWIKEMLFCLLGLALELIY